MRWPGTIQPSRFLSHTGQVMPGVRRVVQVPSPAAGNDWSAVVPAGVMWECLTATATLTTSATVNTRLPFSVAVIDGVTQWSMAISQGVAASQVAVIPIVFSGVDFFPFIYNASSALYLPGQIYPQGAIIKVETSDLEPGDQWSAISLWIQEYYFTDAQLSEDARLHAELEHDIAVYEYQQAEQAVGGT